ncbi:MAG: DsbA family protein [Proteobacteria bacterium]|nr:DsbA family protein [Pseudomonadota bacterium]MBU1686239.1 DsbA family protein [Pseudomonadota bacterium]
MKKSTLIGLALLPFIGGMMVLPCPQPAAAEANFIYKRSTDQNLAAKFKNISISTEEVGKNIQQELFDAEKKAFDLKMNQLKSILLERLIKEDPRSEGLGSEAFLQKYIIKVQEPSEKEITDFILERKVPQNQVNQQLRDRIKAYLIDLQRKSAIDLWLEQATRENPVEVYLTQPEAPKVEIPVTKEDQSKGALDAKVTIVEFSEFQCPYCSRAAVTIAEVLEKYGDQVRLIFKNFPLPSHEYARMAAEYGLCANDQSSEKFWKLHDIMFENQTLLAESTIPEFAEKAGLDMEILKSCIDSGRFKDKIDLDLADGNRAGVNSTPTFFINGIMVKGAQPLEEFSAIIDKTLQK